MIHYVQGNLLQGNVDIIAHQVNCKGVMGSGVALQIKEAFPDVYKAYRRLVFDAELHSHYSRASRSQHLLGTNQYVETINKDRHIIVANLFAQDDFGSGRCFTDYSAFRSCMKNLREYSLFESRLGNRIGLPYKVGCGHGGGDWDRVRKIIYEELHDCSVTFFEL